MINKTIVLGTWAWGNDKAFGDIYGEDRLRKTFESAWEKNIRFFDTAYVYGDGTAERRLASFLAGHDQSDYVLSAKFTPQHADKKVLKPVAEAFFHDLEILGTEYLDWYWYHNPKDFKKYLPEFAELQKEGRIKNIGVSNFSLAQIKEAESLLLSCGARLSGVQNHLSLVNRYSEQEGIIDHCSENGMSFFSYMLFEQGALLGKYRRENPFPEGTERARNYNGVLEKFERLAGMIEKVAGKNVQSGINSGWNLTDAGCDVTDAERELRGVKRNVRENTGQNTAEILIAWALAKGTVPIIGMTKPDHVDPAVKGLDYSLSPGQISLLEEAAEESGLRTVRVWERFMK